MGSCNSKNGDSSADRVARWRSTGIVALRDCKLKMLRDEVLELETSIRTLDLTNNRIVGIPMEIDKLIKMQRMVLVDNLIERLPVSLGKLQSLKVLTLDGNQLTSLPDELGLLIRLEQLSITRNLLSCLPETIGCLRNIPQNLLRDCKALQNISLHDNPISMDQFQQEEHSVSGLNVRRAGGIHYESGSLYFS